MSTKAAKSGPNSAVRRSQSSDECGFADAIVATHKHFGCGERHGPKLHQRQQLLLSALVSFHGVVDLGPHAIRHGVVMNAEGVIEERSADVVGKRQGHVASEGAPVMEAVQLAL